MAQRNGSKRARTARTGDGMDASDGVDAAAVAALAMTPAMTRTHLLTASPTAMANGKPKAAITNGEPSSANGSSSSSAVAADASSNKPPMLPAFLSKTFEIFSMSEFAAICGWNPAGDTIIVSQLEAFVANVLPRFFKHRNFPSFVRQLNLYGFHKTVLDSKRLEFQHPFFKRDRPDLLPLIKRKVSSTGVTATPPQSNARLEVHREVSDNLLKDMKELRQRSDAMEKRLRELEIDNAIVRSDNMKMWKQLETAKDKQMVMQEKMKKIMWILFQIYRGKRGIPKLNGRVGENEEVLSDEYINSSRLGGKEFRDVLHFLAMDEPPLLPRSSTAAVESPALVGSRKRKFIEVPADAIVEAGDDSAQLYRIDPSSSLDISNASIDAALAAVAGMPSLAMPADTSSNALSIFSPPIGVPRIMQNEGTSIPSLASTATPAAATSAPVGEMMDAQGAIVEAIPPPMLPATASAEEEAEHGMDLGFVEDELPLLVDGDHFRFGGEEHVMKKLADFETSLLDEYDVGCLDTLLDQLKDGTIERQLASLPASEPDQLTVADSGPTTPRAA